MSERNTTGTPLAAETPLGAELRRMILAEGPIGLARYMALCLTHPKHGYYVTRDPLGAAGDFVTAPEISQVFGELLGLWAVAVWQQIGQPARVLLAELGPGRGTLMADALRAARVVPAFGAAVSVHLVEASPVLRGQQQRLLADCGVPVRWQADTAEFPDGPLLVLANEFFDALPVLQAVKGAAGWHERMVGLDADGRLILALSPFPIALPEEVPVAGLRNAAQGAIVEWRSDRIMTGLCARLAAHGGAALVVDYGHTQSGFGDTVQAVRGHRFADVLDAPGATDLTAHVDFAALARAARAAGATAHGPVTQREFLLRLGIAARAERLKAGATPAQAQAIDAALARLTGEGEGEMGRLFKATAFSHPDFAILPGFET